MKHYFWACTLGVLLVHSGVGFAKEVAATPDLSKVNDGKTWAVVNADAEKSVQDGKNVVDLKVKGGDIRGQSNIGLALVEGVEFAEGDIEVDLKGKGQRQLSLLGIGFNVVDEKTFEAIYFRPQHFFKGVPDAIQYVSWPDNGWKVLRAKKPGAYESAVNPVPKPDGWFHLRIEVTAKKASVFINDAKEPCMVVDRIATREKGKVGLWVDSSDGYFRNLKITPRK